MRLRAILLSVALVAATPLLTAASPFAEAARRLDGEWRGDGYVLRVDSQRAQASIDPERPFQWQRFLVKEVTGDEIVFAIGAELFEAAARCRSPGPDRHELSRRGEDAALGGSGGPAAAADDGLKQPGQASGGEDGEQSALSRR